MPDCLLVNEYILNLKSGLSDPRAGADLDYTAKFITPTNGKFPDYISEEVFDQLVDKLKTLLIAQGRLLPIPKDHCGLFGCGAGYGQTGRYADGSYINSSCRDNCQKVKEYHELIGKRQELLGENKI